MLSEEFLTSIEGKQNSSNTAISKDVGIYLHSLHPTHSIKSSFKKSATLPNGLAVTPTHIFAAQLGKAVLHVYSRERGNQESLVSFPERIHSIATIENSFVVLGTSEGKLIVWEIFTGRLTTTPPLHLQAITCLAANKSYLLSGSEDSNINVWAISDLISQTSRDVHESLRSLSNHRAPITSLVIGNISATSNICISASKDNTCLVWNYQTGELLRTFLLPATPLCLTLDPCDRAVYIGFEDGTIQLIDFFAEKSLIHPLFDPKLQSAPLQVNAQAWTAPSGLQATLCLATTYDGTALLSGHSSGKVVMWDVGRRCFSAELADLNSPVNNITVIPPFAVDTKIKATTIVKPRVGDYSLLARLVGDVEPPSCFNQIIQSPGISHDLLEMAIVDFTKPITTTVEDDERKENENLWAIVQDQRSLQKRTWDDHKRLRTEVS